MCFMTRWNYKHILAGWKDKLKKIFKKIFKNILDMNIPWFSFKTDV